MLSAVHHTVTLWKGVCSFQTDRHSYNDNSYQFLILEAAFLNGNVGNQQSIASNWFTNSYVRRLGYGGLWLWLYHMEVEVSCCQLYSKYIYIYTSNNNHRYTRWIDSKYTTFCGKIPVSVDHWIVIGFTSFLRAFLRPSFENAGLLYVYMNQYTIRSNSKYLQHYRKHHPSW